MTDTPSIDLPRTDIRDQSAPTPKKTVYRRRVRGIYSFLRFEANAWICTLVGFFKTKLFFDRNKPNKLEIGLGDSPRKPGYITSDLTLQTDFPFDLRLGLPFPDNSLDFIYSEHCLEHFNFEDLLVLLHDSVRTLRPGGKFSVAVPNAKIFLDAYHQPEQFDSDTYCAYKGYKLTYKTKIDYVNYMFYLDANHRYMFDEDNLLAVLAHAGFSSVERRDCDPSLDRKERKFESIYAVATK